MPSVLWRATPPLPPNGYCKGNDYYCKKKWEITKQVGHKSTGFVVETKVVRKIQPKGTGNIDKKWSDLLKCDGEMCGEIWQQLEVE